MPSGIQKLVTHGVPSAFPIAAPIVRHARPCRIQNSRVAWSRMRQREARRARMGEECRIEVEPDAERPRPVDPARRNARARSRRARCAVRRSRRTSAWRLKRCFPGISDSAFAASRRSSSARSRLARIVAGRRQAAADLAAPDLEAADVVSLPAVDARSEPSPASSAPIRVDAKLGVLFAREVVGAL